MFRLKPKHIIVIVILNARLKYHLSESFVCEYDTFAEGMAHQFQSFNFLYLIFKQFLLLMILTETKGFETWPNYLAILRCIHLIKQG